MKLGNKGKRYLLGSLLGFLLLGVAYIGFSLKDKPNVLPVEAEIFEPDLQTSNFKLGIFSLGGQGDVFGANGNEIYKIVDDGTKAERLFTFEHTVTSIHQREDGLMIVATDDDHWDAAKDCRIYRSTDQGKTFELIKTIKGGAALWWSIDSDRAGRLFLAEYGPHQIGWSKTLWRSEDDGDHWQIAYQAPNEDKTHLHRVAVDPFTQDIWLTVGDGKNRAMLKSSDHGETWQTIEALQATAVAFSERAIYWGKDEKGQAGVLRYDRITGVFTKIFEPQKLGAYGGSIYDMVRLASGEIIVSFMKYADQDHIASVWHGSGDDWLPMLHLASEQGKSAGSQTIAGPDKAGWVYLTGYQFKVN